MPSTEDMGSTELKRVVQLFRNEATELIHVTVNGEEIVCTPEHPFYSPIKGWTAAIKLRAGDILVTVNGEYVIVEQIQHELLESPVTVYNFEVEGFHTYYVGNDDGVLVHNTCSTQRHHVMSNKNKTYTPKFQKITDTYGLNLNHNWNIRLVTNHMGRHSTTYHEWVLQKVTSFDIVAAGDQAKFLNYFNVLAEYIINHPNVMY